MYFLLTEAQQRELGDPRWHSLLHLSPDRPRSGRFGSLGLLEVCGHRLGLGYGLLRRDPLGRRRRRLLVDQALELLALFEDPLQAVLGLGLQQQHLFLPFFQWLFKKPSEPNKDEAQQYRRNDRQ